MPDATFADYHALATHVITQDFPIMPQPTWGQDAAYVGFVIDRLVAENERLRAAYTELREWADRMTDAGITTDDPRLQWWYDRPDKVWPVEDVQVAPPPVPDNMGAAGNDRWDEKRKVWLP